MFAIRTPSTPRTWQWRCTEPPSRVSRARRASMAKVMVVDDAYSELKLMESILKNAGHQVVTLIDAAAERAQARRACVVMLGGRPFAVDVGETREVVVLDVTTPVPGAPAALVGVMNLRGSVLPVIEARPLLGLPVRAAVGRPRALVLAEAGHRAAVLIERVLGLTAFDAVLPPADG